MGGEVLLHPAEWQAVWLSLRVAACCVAVTLLPGIALGWLLARRRFAGKTWVEAAVQLPMVMPPVLVGYLLLVTLGRRGGLGGWLEEALGIRLAFTTTAAVIAAAVVSLPLLVRAVRLAMESADRGIEEAARTTGAGPWDVLWSVTLPAAWPGILAGMLLTFVRSVGEFGATIMFAGNIAGETRTLPLALYRGMQTPGGEASVARLAVAAIALSILAVAASELIHRRLATRKAVS